jgi:hypothetical protein
LNKRYKKRLRFIKLYDNIIIDFLLGLANTQRFAR